jgi:enediyne biosynthesis protein E4
VTPVLHFGLGAATIVDSLRIIWPRGRSQVLDRVKADQLMVLNEADAVPWGVGLPVVKPFFGEVAAPIPFDSLRTTTNDFKRQPLMVNPISFSGACLAKGDVNGDGLADIYIGGHDGKAGAIYLQNKDGKFTKQVMAAFEQDKACTDAAAVFFDAKGDGKTDLYVCSGGYNDYMPGDRRLQDRLYLNDGKGNFIRAVNALPEMLSSKSCVKVADVNGDGFLDLFVGGRVIPNRYPETPESYLLINDGKGHFTDQTDAYDPGLKHIGMVTDAAWVDMNGDHHPDLILVGEWMPITVLENRQGKLVDASNHYFDKPASGWWNCLAVGDWNRDGHPDLIVGNLGLNSQCRASESEPAELYYKDFDGDGKIDPILCLYIQHKSYPYVTRDELLDQMSILRSRFPDYKSYADATIGQVFAAEELAGAKILKADHLATALFLSDSSGRVHETSLPIEAQYAPVYTITSLDYDHDGKGDLLLCGNMNHARLRFGKYDANYGVLLHGDGKGTFRYVEQSVSGFNLRGDVRGVEQLNDVWLFSMDKGLLKAYHQVN